jgi:hypothetical protein
MVTRPTSHRDSYETVRTSPTIRNLATDSIYGRRWRRHTDERLSREKSWLTGEETCVSRSSLLLDSPLPCPSQHRPRLHLLCRSPRFINRTASSRPYAQAAGWDTSDVPASACVIRLSVTSAEQSAGAGDGMEASASGTTEPASAQGRHCRYYARRAKLLSRRRFGVAILPPLEWP